MKLLEEILVDSNLEQACHKVVKIKSTVLTKCHLGP